MDDSKLQLDELGAVAGGKSQSQIPESSEPDTAAGSMGEKPTGTSKGFCAHCQWVQVPNDTVQFFMMGYPIGTCPICGKTTEVGPLL